MRVRRLIRADHGGTSRFLFVIRCSSLSREPVVLFTEGCRRRGSARMSRRPPAPSNTQMAIFRPARDLALSIEFDPGCLPRRCVAFFRPRCASPPEERGEGTFDQKTRTFQFITLDPLPGQYGIRWSWA